MVAVCGQGVSLSSSNRAFQVYFVALILETVASLFESSSGVLCLCCAEF